MLGVRHEEYGGVRRTTRALAAMAAALLTLGSLAACGGDDDGGDAEAIEDLDATTTTEAGGETTDTTEALTPEEQVVAAYTAAQNAFSAASNPPNPDAPELATSYTGDALARLQENLRGMQASGAGAQTTVELHPSAVVISGTTATLVDCFVDNTQMVELGTGRPLGSPGQTTLHVDVSLEQVDGVWKVADQTERSTPCTPG